MSGILELGNKAISVSDNPLIRLEDAATICQTPIGKCKSLSWGFLSM